jgi:hypothetical protein
MRGWRDFFERAAVLDFSVEISKNFQIVWTRRGEIEIENY